MSLSTAADNAKLIFYASHPSSFINLQKLVEIVGNGSRCYVQHSLLCELKKEETN